MLSREKIEELYNEAEKRILMDVLVSTMEKIELMNEEETIEEVINCYSGYEGS